MSKWPVLKVTEMINRQCFHEFFSRAFVSEIALWLLTPYAPETEIDNYEFGAKFKLLLKINMQWYFRKQNKFYFSEFGPIVIDYGKVQAKVSMKYDSWHKDALSKFGTMLGTDMSSFHSTVMNFLQIACNLMTIFIKYNNIWILTFFL